MSKINHYQNLVGTKCLLKDNRKPIFYIFLFHDKGMQPYTCRWWSISSRINLLLKVNITGFTVDCDITARLLNPSADRGKGTGQQTVDSSKVNKGLEEKAEEVLGWQQENWNYGLSSWKPGKSRLVDWNPRLELIQAKGEQGTSSSGCTVQQQWSRLSQGHRLESS